MALEIVEADAFVEAQRCGYLAHGCNTMGEMGAGFALHVRLKYPKTFKAYTKFCNDNDSGLIIGGFFMTEPENGVQIYNLFTQVYKGKWAREEYIESSCYTMLSDAKERKVGEIAVPYLIGCGFGGLKEEKVLPIIEAVSADFPDTKLTICKLEKKY